MATDVTIESAYITIICVAIYWELLLLSPRRAYLGVASAEEKLAFARTRVDAR